MGNLFGALAGGVRCLGFLLLVRFVLAMLFLLPVRSLHVSAFPPAGALPPSHRKRQRSLLFLVPVRSLLFLVPVRSMLFLVPVWSLLFLLLVRSLLFLLSGESFRLSFLASPLLLLTIDCVFNIVQPASEKAAFFPILTSTPSSCRQVNAATPSYAVTRPCEIM